MATCGGDVMHEGWVVEVDAEAGPLLFAVRTTEPYDAEDIVRRQFAISEERDVIAIRPITVSELEKMGVIKDEARGPI